MVDNVDTGILNQQKETEIEEVAVLTGSGLKLAALPPEDRAETLSLDSFKIEAPLFEPQDIGSIRANGLVTWAMAENVIQADSWFDWRTFPMVIRQAMVNDLATGLGIDFSYLLPFRRIGRVAIFAILPAPIETIRISRRVPPRRSQANSDLPSRPHLLDPPVPAFVLGLAPKEVQTLYHQTLASFLRRDDPAPLRTQVGRVVELMARARVITKPEMFYFLSAVQSLVNGSWRQLTEYAGMFDLMAVIEQSTSGNQGFSFALAEAVLSSNTRLMFDQGAQNAAALPEQIELEANDSLF